MKNIELKVKVGSFVTLRHALKSSKATRYGGILRQTDVYFNSRHGRLKLRNINKTDFELISYERPNKLTSKMSSYEICIVDAGQAKVLQKIMEQSLGKTIVVQKKRELWIYKNTRIHLDTVQGLGTFAELETVVKNITLAQAKMEQQKVIKLLNLSESPKIKGSYSDILRSHRG